MDKPNLKEGILVVVDVWGQVESPSLPHISQKSWTLVVSLLPEVWKTLVS